MGQLKLGEQAAASTPESGSVVLYPKTDALLYAKDDTGIEYKLSNQPKRKNGIINGDFNVWQRGTSFASVADNTYSADRWVYRKSGSMVHDITRSTDVPTLAQAGRLYNYSILVDCQTIDATIAAGDYAILQQKIEGYNFLPLAQRTLIIQFWVKATKTGIYCVAINNSGFDRSYVAEYSVSVTDTWELKTVVLVATPSGGTWDYTTGVGLQINFTLAGGSTFQTTAGAWATGNFFSTSNQVNACDNVANNFRICGVQIEVGNTPSDFEYRTFQEELALCQRYYVRWTGPASVATWAGYVSAGAGVWCFVPFPVPMRSTPTGSVANATWTGSNLSSTSVVRADSTGMTIQHVASADAASSIYMSSGYIDASIEL